jgi:MFS transporter, DHA1 family, tetracycline resistance protein
MNQDTGNPVAGENVVKRSPLLIIFLTVFVDLLGLGIVLPLLPFYVQIVEQSSNPWLAGNWALIVGALTASYALMQFLFSPLVGGLSDRFGRRPVLLISLLGTGISMILLGLAGNFAVFGVEAVLLALFGARILGGIAGATIPTAQAYIADVTTPENRARGMGLIGAAFGLGFMFGPALGGFLSGISLQAPAFFAATLALLNAGLGFFLLPESLPAERRAAAVPLRFNPLGRLAVVIASDRIRPLLLAYVLMFFAFAGLQTNFAVFSATRFGFGPMENAFVFAFIGLVAVIMQGFLIRKLVPRFGEARLAVTGMGMMTLAFLLIAIVPQAWMLYPALGLLAAGSGVVTPSVTSLISRRVSPQEQGATLGGVQALNSLMMVLGPIFAGFIFDAVGVAAPYLTGGALIGLSLLLLARALRDELATTRTAPAQNPGLTTAGEGSAD